MTQDLWSANDPARFWQCTADLPAAYWEEAFQAALPGLKLPRQPQDVEEMLALTLGEGQFGAARWRLSPAKRVYYLLKPMLPRSFTRVLRRIYSRPDAVRSWSQGGGNDLGWPAETRYARFQWEIMRQLVGASGERSLSFTHFWPNGRKWAFVLTHDVETASGQAFVRDVAELDESFGFRSLFNFVPERYPLDYELIEELLARGFEVGVHGLKHDGKLFRSRSEFMRRAEIINGYLKELGATGFRAPLTHRQAEWMQVLDIDYDLSFFDTDPYEPMPGGTMSLWPFVVGRFVELPYTLVQDYVLTAVLQERTPRLWLDKVDVIVEYHGMALLNSHPDYLRADGGLAIYRRFLHKIRERGGYWHALPRDVARWWRARLGSDPSGAGPDATSSVGEFYADGRVVIKRGGGRMRTREPAVAATSEGHAVVEAG